MTESEFIGLIAGNGALPVEFAKRAAARGFRVLAIGATPGVSPEIAEHVERFLPIPITQWGHVVHALERHGVPPGRLVVEVTETGILPLLESLQPDFAVLRAAGIGIHVDDFGTGYSSISLLRDLPINGLKLDASFTRRLLDQDGKAAVLAAGLSALATSLGICSIAEGVETEDDAAILLEQGWTHAQGWLFGRPQPLPEEQAAR